MSERCATAALILVYVGLWAAVGAVVGTVYGWTWCQLFAATCAL
jgi:hypothetical protein